MTDNKISEKLKKLVDGLDSNEKDALYRYLWAEHVGNDVWYEISENFEEDVPPEKVEAVVEDVVSKYVYDCEYDCNLSYWDNIHNLTKKAINRINN